MKPTSIKILMIEATFLSASHIAPGFPSSDLILRLVHRRILSCEGLKLTHLCRHKLIRYM